MVDPVVALAVFGVLVVFTVLLFRPRRGWVPRVARLLKLTDRVLMEDALKHLYNCQYLDRAGTLESLAGALEVSRSRAVKLAAALEVRELAYSTPDGGLRLSKDGEAYALRVLRSHRLWERYLADRTNVDPTEWHDRAEEREHSLTHDDNERLAARMGDPLYDPHGDPIPTAAGELPPATGVPLTALEPGRSATVVHLEDEPVEVYDQLVAQGLAPQVQLRLLSVTPEALQFQVDGQTHQLEPVVAANVTVEPLPESETVGRPLATLAELTPGERATVLGISPACQGPQRRRLLDLGVVPGTEIRSQLTSVFGDPVAYEIRGASIALRRQQAEWIQVDRRLAKRSA
jgi:DtxR family transcriptional regulator, Mn-dependent transcriptional regulator